MRVERKGRKGGRGKGVKDRRIGAREGTKGGRKRERYERRQRQRMKD